MPTAKQGHRFSTGDEVIIKGKRVKLAKCLSEIEGGWIVAPKVEDCRYWNEQEMRRVKRARVYG
jgi:hypothetical protein